MADKADGTWSWFLNARVDMKQHYDPGTLIQNEQF